MRMGGEVNKEVVSLLGPYSYAHMCLSWFLWYFIPYNITVEKATEVRERTRFSEKPSYLLIPLDMG